LVAAKGLADDPMEQILGLNARHTERGSDESVKVPRDYFVTKHLFLGISPFRQPPESIFPALKEPVCPHDAASYQVAAVSLPRFLFNQNRLNPKFQRLGNHGVAGSLDCIAKSRVPCSHRSTDATHP
jgi:hypothetical protein